MTKHYYFKFQTGNKGLKEWEKKEKRSITEGVSIPLSIYFGHWRYNQKKKGIDLQKGRGAKKQKTQIRDFYSIRRNFTKAFFWLFYRRRILCCKPETGRIYDGPNKDGKKSFPKSMNAKVILVRSQTDLPGVFANINSNQTYNRGTIAELKGTEEKSIAELLISKNKKNKIKISQKNYLKFLSPIEFETLIFLIFNKKRSSFCSSFRGGTLPDFDFKVSILKRFHGLSKGIYQAQVKKKPKTKIEPQKEEIVVYAGKKTYPSKRIFGSGWISNIVSKRPDIVAWLRKMTFNYDIFEVDRNFF